MPEYSEKSSLLANADPWDDHCRPPASLELSMKLKVETQSTSLPINKSVNEVLPSAELISVQKLGHAENH